MSSSYLVEQLAEIRSQVAELKRGRTTHRAAQVLTSDPATGTFTALLPNGEQLSGVSAPLQFLPAAGEQILLRLDGATPIYEPAGIAEDAITGREIAPGAIDTTQLAFDISQYTGGTRIFYGAETPTTDAAGDLWLKELDPGPPPKYETRRWDGQAWTLLQDQGVTEALAKAVAAESAANQAGIDALAALGAADEASGTALTAQQAAEAAANAAAGKTTTFRQDAQPPTTGRTVGDEWIETDQGNRRHVWTGAAWTLTQIGQQGIGIADFTNYADGSDFEGATPHPWQLTSGAVVSTEQARRGTRSLKLPAGTSQATLPQTIPVQPGDKVRFHWWWMSTPDFNGTSNSSKIRVADQNGAVRAAFNMVGAQATWKEENSVYAVPATGVTGLQVTINSDGTTGAKYLDDIEIRRSIPATELPSARELGAITTYKQATAPTTGVINGDFWIRSTDNRVHVRVNGAWEESKDADINTALTNAATAQATADGKVRIFAQPDAPLNMTAGDVGDLWIDTNDSNVSYTWSGTAWVKRRIGNGAIEPQSLVARDVIATGTISAALFEAIIVLATIIILGNPEGNHQRLDASGSRVYRIGPDQQLIEAGRLGFGAGDYLGGGGRADGGLAWMIPDNGVPSFQGANISGDPTIMGRKFTKWISAAPGSGNGQPEIPGAQHWIGWAPGGLDGITTEVGIIEMAVDVSRDRWYWVGFDVGYRRQETNEIALRIRDGGTGSPTIASPEIMLRTVTDGQVGATNTAFRMGIWYPDVSGVHRLGLTAATQAGGVTDVLSNPLPAMIVIDMGPRKPVAASVNRMGGGVNPPPPPAAARQQHYRDLAPAGWTAWRGDGTIHSAATGPVQGYTQYAPQNGDARGHWWFALPSITGTIDRIDFYCYTPHWHFDSGGTAIFNIAIGGQGGPNYPKPMPNFEIAGMPKPGERTVTLPADWYPFFRDGGANGYPRADGITVGPSGGTNPLFYGRFDGNSARLRIWYTQ